MNPSVLAHLILPFLIAVCTASLTEEDIAKILSETASDPQLGDMGRFPSNEEAADFKERFSKLDMIDNDRGDIFGADPGADNPGDDGVSKRPFCNGFTGCRGMSGKRALLPLLNKLRLSKPAAVQSNPAISKRPFCNGFFGCGNPGKRLVFRNNPNILHANAFPKAPTAPQRKRFFCNPGAFGCSNGGKRSPYRNWFERLRTSSEPFPGLDQLE